MALILVFFGISAFSNYYITVEQTGRYFNNLRIGPWETLQIQRDYNSRQRWTWWRQVMEIPGNWSKSWQRYFHS